MIRMSRIKKDPGKSSVLFYCLAVEWNIVHGDLIFHGFQVSDNICHAECLADIAFEVFSNMMSVMNGPCAWDKHMHCNKATRSRLAGAQGMEFHTLFTIFNHDLLDHFLVR